jgi:hypothetical protein
MLLTLIIDLQIIPGLQWFWYAGGALVLSYVVTALPAWFRKPNPVIFVPCDFGAVALYLLLISCLTEGNWFLTFALPVTGIITIVISSITILCYYLKRGYLYIFGGALIGAGLFFPVIETLAIITFQMRPMLWSLYPLIALFLIGIMLIVIAIVKPFRESLCRIFAI